VTSIRVEVDRDLCMGSGNCSYWAPEVFDLDDEGIAIVIADPSAHPERVALAVEGCPTAALSIHPDGPTPAQP
jgi:ferredoxin